MAAKTISTARALVADGAVLSRLLDEVLDAEDIRTQLDKLYFTRRWQHSMGQIIQAEIGLIVEIED
jgi:hypothetical protein